MKRIFSGWNIFVEAVREIFDEGAYARFLKRAGLGSSKEAYAAFRLEAEDAKVPRVKCC